MFHVGCSSDIALVKEMGVEKTAHQVGRVKRRILSQYPDWKETFSCLSETSSQPTWQVSCMETESSDTRSEEASSGPNMPPDNLEVEVIVLEKGTQELEEASGMTTNIVIMYPLQVVLECPHCHMKWVGEALEGYADHIASHEEFAHSWMFLCALCAYHTSTSRISYTTYAATIFLISWNYLLLPSDKVRACYFLCSRVWPLG